MTPQLKTVFAVLVMGAWFGSAVFAWLTYQYVPLTIMTPLMLLIGGAAFGVHITKNGRNGR